MIGRDTQTLAALILAGFVTWVIIALMFGLVVGTVQLLTLGLLFGAVTLISFMVISSIIIWVFR